MSVEQVTQIEKPDILSALNNLEWNIEENFKETQHTTEIFLWLNREDTIKCCSILETELNIDNLLATS